MKKELLEAPSPDSDELGPHALIATITAKPEHSDALQEGLLSLVPLTGHEDDSVVYHLHRGHADPNVFVFEDAWKAPGALQAHKV